jgi:hypothetical protein
MEQADKFRANEDYKKNSKLGLQRNLKSLENQKKDRFQIF